MPECEILSLWFPLDYYLSIIKPAQPFCGYHRQVRDTQFCLANENRVFDVWYAFLPPW